MEVINKEKLHLKVDIMETTATGSKGFLFLSLLMHFLFAQLKIQSE